MTRCCDLALVLSLPNSAMYGVMDTSGYNTFAKKTVSLPTLQPPSDDECPLEADNVRVNLILPKV